jgi:hypothetical protein
MREAIVMEMHVIVSDNMLNMWFKLRLLSMYKSRSAVVPTYSFCIVILIFVAVYKNFVIST